MKILVDYERAELVFGKLLSALPKRQYPYDRVKPPHAPENLPKTLELGSVNHAWFLKDGCLWMRGGVKSDTAIKSLGSLYDDQPKLFVPKKARIENPQRLAWLFKEHGLPFQKTNAGYWISNADRLYSWWDSNPLLIYDNITTYSDPYDELCKRIAHQKNSGFFGFQKKMTSMITHFFMDSGLISKFIFPIPIDFHLLRFMVMHEILKVSEGLRNGNWYEPEVEEAARQVTYRYCKRNEVSPLVLCDTLWLYIRFMCSKHPGTRSRVVRRDGRKSVIDPISVVWNKSQSKAYENSCGSCVVEDTCKFVAGAASYYIKGVLLFAEERVKPSQQAFFSLAPSIPRASGLS